MRLSLVLISVVVVLLTLGACALFTPDRTREAVTTAYLRSPKDLITIDGVRLHVRDDGPKDAPAILMMHGFASSLHTFEPWAKALEGEFRVVRFDVPGAGLSGPDPTGDYSDPRTLHIIGALMDKLAIRKATLLGNSMGGRFAWEFAAAHPDRVDKLILISPDGFASHGLEYGKRPDVPFTVKLMRYVLPKSLLRMNLKVAYADPSRLTDATVQRYYDLLLAPGVRDATIARMGQVVLQNPEKVLPKINAPTLLLWGRQDKMIPVDNAADYARLIPHSKTVILDNLGHVPFEEDPVGSLPPVRAFLQSPQTD